MEEMYGEAGEYTLLCRSFEGYRGEELRWLSPGRGLLERKEWWDSEWQFNVFRLVHRREREEVAERYGR